MNNCAFRSGLKQGRVRGFTARRVNLFVAAWCFPRSWGHLMGRDSMQDCVDKSYSWKSNSGLIKGITSPIQLSWMGYPPIPPRGAGTGLRKPRSRKKETRTPHLSFILPSLCWLLTTLFVAFSILHFYCAYRCFYLRSKVMATGPQTRFTFKSGVRMGFIHLADRMHPTPAHHYSIFWCYRYLCQYWTRTQCGITSLCLFLRLLSVEVCCTLLSWKAKADGLRFVPLAGKRRSDSCRCQPSLVSGTFFWRALPPPLRLCLPLSTPPARHSCGVLLSQQQWFGLVVTARRRRGSVLGGM